MDEMSRTGDSSAAISGWIQWIVLKAVDQPGAKTNWLSPTHLAQLIKIFQIQNKGIDQSALKHENGSTQKRQVQEWRVREWLALARSATCDPSFGFFFSLEHCSCWSFPLPPLFLLRLSPQPMCKPCQKCKRRMVRYEHFHVVFGEGGKVHAKGNQAKHKEKERKKVLVGHGASLQINQILINASCTLKKKCK